MLTQTHRGLGSDVVGGEQSVRLTLIDYLRGLAALSVCWFHLTNQYAADSPVRISGSYGWLGVEIFFVISGFIIPWSMNGFGIFTLRSYGRFIARRALRVELPYVASIILVVVLWHLAALRPGFAGTAPSWTFEQIALHIVYLIPFSHYEWLQPVYWSLAYEFAFYLFIGLAFTPIVAAPNSWLFRALSMVLAVAVLVGVLSMYFLLFVMGCVAYRRFANRCSFTEFFTTIAIALAAMAAAEGLLQGLVGAVSAALMVLAPTLRLPGQLGLILGWLGTVSYSLYLVHSPIGGRVVNLIRRFAGGAAAELLISLLALAVSLLAAAAFHKLIEKPAHRLAHRLKF